MFQFTAFPFHSYGFAVECQRFSLTGFPIRISPDLWLCAPPRSFSQLFASFIGSWCQGILPMLFLAWLLSRLLRSSIYVNNYCLRKFSFFCLVKLFVVNNYSLRLFWNNKHWHILLSRCRCVFIFSFQSTMVSELSLSYRMETTRFELVTPCLQGRCSPNWATPPLWHLWAKRSKRYTEKG